MKIGIQVSSLKPLLGTEAQVRKAFAQMGALGCRAVQIQWVDPAVPHTVIAEAVADNRMESLGTQDFYVTIRDNLEYYVNLNAATGGKWLCLSRIPEEYKSLQGLPLFVEELRQLQKKLEPLGQRICFHPVSADFTAVPGLDAVAWLLENMPELDLCLDLYHLNRNCGDMPGFIRRYAGRICMVHFKDAREGKLVPAGQGDTDWTGVVQACVEAKVPYGFVEQETWDRDPYDCLKEAMDWTERELENA